MCLLRPLTVNPVPEEAMLWASHSMIRFWYITRLCPGAFDLLTTTVDMYAKEKLDWDQQSKPPAYSDTSSDQPPAYTPPSAFVIGSRTLTHPLVQIQELKAHLSLLRAFKNLRTVVEDGKVAEWPEVVRMLDPQQRWAWFVGLAVDRYVTQAG